MRQTPVIKPQNDENSMKIRTKNMYFNSERIEKYSLINN